MQSKAPMVNCRAQVSEHCSQGSTDVYPTPEDMRSDSSWDGHTVVCDACYICVKPFVRMNTDSVCYAINTGVDTYRRNLRHVQDHPHPEQLVEQATAAFENATPGSPYHASARAAYAMAQAEVERRAAA